ncbi:Os07g0552149 [Oryza sativa Japonica Group]|uniref:Os07g0552149 protein n=1 Tax=Oryza sativa subsp. japonica TaxID=39947 RepID=A0A0P0X7C4_ORYSJ|nr:Os07g0552149 [Oryza sativa Japonica Group]
MGAAMCCRPGHKPVGLPRQPSRGTSHACHSSQKLAAAVFPRRPSSAARPPSFRARRTAPSSVARPPSSASAIVRRAAPVFRARRPAAPVFRIYRRPPHGRCRLARLPPSSASASSGSTAVVFRLGHPPSSAFAARLSSG